MYPLEFLYFYLLISKTNLMETTEIIINTLKKSGMAMKSGEIAAIAGIDKAEVDKVIKKLKKDDKIVSPKNCYYQLK
jgi:hypothetical protein